MTPSVAAPSVKLTTNSHSNLQLGKQAVIKLSFHLPVRPSIMDYIQVVVTTENTRRGNFATPTGSSLSYLMNQIDQLTVTFIPIVSGKHIITVTTQDGNDSVTVNVAGKPQIGAAVVPGPHWDHGPRYVCYGTHVHGVVTDNKEEGCVSVLWDGEGKPSVHVWGRLTSHQRQKVQRGHACGYSYPTSYYSNYEVQHGHDLYSHHDLYGVQLDL